MTNILKTTIRFTLTRVLIGALVLVWARQVNYYRVALMTLAISKVPYATWVNSMTGLRLQLASSLKCVNERLFMMIMVKFILLQRYLYKNCYLINLTVQGSTSTVGSCESRCIADQKWDLTFLSSFCFFFCLLLYSNS